jgi:hypothetical protein
MQGGIEPRGERAIGAYQEPAQDPDQFDAPVTVM